MSFNVREWTRDRDKTSPDYWKVRLGSIRRCVLDTDPDIICLQECWPRMARAIKRLGYKGHGFHHLILTRKTMRPRGHHWHIFFDWLDVDGTRIVNVHGRWERKVAERIIPKVAALCAGRKAVACGDYNVKLPVIERIGFGLTHVRSFLNIPCEDTFQNPKKAKDHGEIDHFFTNLIKPETFRLIKGNYGCVRMSDHHPIIMTY